MDIERFAPVRYEHLVLVNSQTATTQIGLRFQVPRIDLGLISQRSPVANGRQRCFCIELYERFIKPRTRNIWRLFVKLASEPTGTL